MKHIVKPKALLCAVLCSLSLTNLPIYAQSSDDSLRLQIHQIMLQTQALQKEVNSLRAQLAQEKQQHHRKKVSSKTKPSVSTEKKPYKHYVEPLVQENNTPVAVMTRFRHPVTVTTSPFMGIRSAYNASDVLEQDAFINEDLLLLKKRAQLAQTLMAEEMPLNRPVLELSGGVEGQLYSQSGFDSGATDGINLSNVELDMQAVASNWASAFISLGYDNSPVAQGSRAPKGDIYLRRGFVTIGDLLQFPVYASLGEMYVPFGKFDSAMVSAPLTMSLARIRTTVGLLGYYAHRLNVVIFGYDGFMTSGGSPVFKQGGARVGYAGSIGKLRLGGNASVISNIADSEGMQGNGLPLALNAAQNPMNYGGFAVNPGGDNLRYRVPAMDFNGKVGLGAFTLIGEYAGAITRFNPNDIYFISPFIGAKPQAVHAELDYSTSLWTKPTVLAVTYGHTWQALALNLPETSYAIVMNISLWKDTIEAFEFRHDVDYRAGTLSGGAGTISVPPSNVGTGGTRNSFIAQLGVYF